MDHFDIHKTDIITHFLCCYEQENQIILIIFQVNIP